MGCEQDGIIPINLSASALLLIQRICRYGALAQSRAICLRCVTTLPFQPHWACPILCLQLDTEKLEKIPILKKLRALEEQAGKDVTLGAVPDAAEPGLQTGQPKRQTRRRPRQNMQQDAEGESRQDYRQEKRAETEQKGRQRPARVRKESRGDGGGGREGEQERERVKRGLFRWREKGFAALKGSIVFFFHIATAPSLWFSRASSQHITVSL